GARRVGEMQTPRRRVLALGAAGAAVLAGPSPATRTAHADDAPADLPWAQPGPYLGPGSADFDVVRQESFRPDQRVAVTYFFYWFDAQSLKQQRAARGGAGGYPFTPVNADTMSFFDPDRY